MLPIQKKIKLIMIGVSCCIVLGFLLEFIFSSLPASLKFDKTLDNSFYYILFSPSLKPPANLIIIDSQDPDESRIRAEYADLIRQLTQANAKCIACDIVFSEPRSYDLPGNQKLIEAVADCNQIILAINFDSDRTPSGLTRAIVEELTIPIVECEDILLPRINMATTRGVDFPVHDLLAVAKHIGHINPVNKEYYHFPIAVFYRDHCYPSLPLEITKVFEGNKSYRSLLQQIPLDKEGQLLVNFIAPARFEANHFTWSDALSLLTNQPQCFDNGIILFINSATDPLIPTPIGYVKSWVVVASVTSQLLLNRHIEASIFYKVFISGIIVMVGLVWFLFFTARIGKKWRKTRFIILPGNIILLIIIIIMLRFCQQWLGVMSPFLILNISFFIVRTKYYGLIQPPKFEHLEVYVLEAQKGFYIIKIKSSVGEEEGNACFETFFEDETFQEILQKIKNLSADRTEMRWMGNRLFDVLFQGDIFYILKSSLEKVKRENKFLRLRLSFDAPELICLPWELMHSSKLPPGFLSLNKRLCLTRYISLFQPLTKPEFHVPLKILVIVSHPSDLPSLNVSREIKILEKSLRLLRWGGDVRLRFCRKATLDNLRHELDREPDVIHYIGHSCFDPDKNESFLCFESDSNRHELVDQETIGNMLHDSSVKLVILNSCESATASESDAFTGMAQNLVRIGVPAVLAMQIEIPDPTAVWFSSVFYTTFLTKYSIEFAVAEARRYIMTKIKLDRPDWAIPVLFMRSGETFQI